MSVDYLQLNAVTVRHQYPTPVIEELLEKLSRYKLFTVLDFMAEYYQIPVHPDSRKYTAFATHDCHFEFTRMPFDILNAPSVFQSCMPPGAAMAYLDDVVIPSQTVEEGVQKLRIFLLFVSEMGLTLRISKCVFLSECVKFLGHKVSQDAFERDDNKVSAIREVPTTPRSRVSPTSSENSCKMTSESPNR